VTFAKDVSPILQTKCQSCHAPGSIGPMSLVTYQDAGPWARSIKQRVESRQMPPWHIDRSVGVNTFKNDMSLSGDAGRGDLPGWAHPDGQLREGLHLQLDDQLHLRGGCGAGLPEGHHHQGDRTVDGMAHAWMNVVYLSDAEYAERVATSGEGVTNGMKPRSNTQQQQ